MWVLGILKSGGVGLGIALPKKILEICVHQFVGFGYMERERERKRERGNRIHWKIINHVNLKINIIMLHSCLKEPKCCIGYYTSLGS